MDTGANVSLIKHSKIIGTNTFCDPSEKIILSGLGTSPVHTAASMTFDGEIYGHKVPIKIHIVKQDCNIPFDGLIGNDFLQPQNAQIDYKNCTLKIDSLPFNIPIYLNCNPNKNESYILKARTEAVIEVNIISDNLNEGIIKETPIIDGVYLAKSIVKVNNLKLLQ